LGIFQSTLLGNASIGIYCLATDEVVIVPKLVPEKKVKMFGKWLKVKFVETNIGDSILVGILPSANSNGIVLPHYVRDEEIKAIKSSLNINFTIMKSRRTAFGNMVLANDFGAIVDPRLKSREVKDISDVLDVEVVSGEIAGLPYVGSLAFATNKGTLVHPLIKEKEQKLLADVLKVPINLGTINCGIPYVATGLIGNKWGAVVGNYTTGPEMFIIGHALGLVGE